MTQPFAKKPRVSITQRSGGFTHLHEEIVRWELFNFQKFFLTTKMNLGLLRQQHLNFVVDALDDFPQTEWKVFFVVDRNPNDYNRYGYGFNNLEYAENWLISLKYELVGPPVKADLEGLYLMMECDLARQDSIINSFPDSGILEANGTGNNLFPLCKISDRGAVLLVDGNGSLVLNLKFLFYKANVASAESEDVTRKRKLKMNVFEDLKAFFTKEGADEITVVANNGEKFVIQKDLLKARSTVLSAMLEDKDKTTMTLDFPPEVVAWMLDFVRNGEVKAFAVKKEDEDAKQDLTDNEESNSSSGTDAKTKDLPTLSQLIRFADMYEFQDLKEYFDFKLPSLCAEAPDFAPYLNHLAIKFSLNQAKEKIPTFLARHSDLVLKMMKAEVDEEDL